jgi:hypothetical protein
MLQNDKNIASQECYEIVILLVLYIYTHIDTYTKIQTMPTSMNEITQKHCGATPNVTVH